MPKKKGRKDFKMLELDSNEEFTVTNQNDEIAKETSSLC